MNQSGQITAVQATSSEVANPNKEGSTTITNGLSTNYLHSRKKFVADKVVKPGRNKTYSNTVKKSNTKVPSTDINQIQNTVGTKRQPLTQSKVN